MPAPLTTYLGLRQMELGDKNKEAIFNLLAQEFDKRLGNNPHALVRATSNQACASGSQTAIVFDTEHADTDGMHDTASNTDRLTVRTAGRYEVGGALIISASAGGTYRAVLLARYNAAGTLQEVFGAASIAPHSGAALAVNVIGVTQGACAAGDFFRLLLEHDAGASLNSVASSTLAASSKYAPLFWASRLPN